MKNNVQEKIKKYRKKTIWPSVIFFLISSIIVSIAVSLSAAVFLASILDAKLAQEKIRADMVGNAIVDGVNQGGAYDQVLEQYQKSLGSADAIRIINKDYEVLAGYGDANVDFSDDLHMDSVYGYNVYIDRDSPNDLDRNGDINIGIFDLLQKTMFVEAVGMTDEDIEGKDLLTMLYGEEKIPLYQYYIWVESDLTVDENAIYVRCDLNLFKRDLFWLAVMALLSMVLLISLLIGQLVNSIINIHRQQMLSKSLFMDVVTGGNNWLYYTNQAHKRLKPKRNASKTYAVVDFTLMKYRNYCTLHGVKAGEQLLAELYAYLSTCMKKKEICARYGKSSFAFFLNVEAGDENVEALQRRILEIMDNATEAINHKHIKKNQADSGKGCGTLTFHAGIALIDDKVVDRKNVDISQIYNNAGIARGTIGSDEGNQVVCFNHQMWETQIWEHKVEDMMQEALNNEEFQVYIQPKFNPVTETLAGAEALVRWISPTEGFVSPGKFIPIFEKTGFVTQLDDYMISHVAKLQAEWLAKGEQVVPISVNVSRAHFAQPDLAEHIRDLVDAYQVPHEYIEIELTESAFFDDKDALLTTVKRLQNYGFDVSMDDFGSGYSSLNSLKDLPLNVLKLDAEFFRGEDVEHRGEIVVARAIALAKQLNMRIVAEGVEKKEQVEFLANQDCDMIQGFYFAKPMPADEYEGYLTK